MCINCGNKLSEQISFKKDKIGYILCDKCSHLNGVYRDTNSFCNEIYKEDSIDYKETYNSKDKDTYIYRLMSIYQPKAEFLYSMIKEEKNPNQLSYFDFGAGSGYFVGALKSMGLKKVYGSEVSIKQVNYANKMLGSDSISHHDFEESIDLLSKTNCNVVSMIGVLEHLQDPRSALKVIKDNKKYRIPIPFITYV